MDKKKVLLLVAGDNGTIGLCSLNLYEAFKMAPEYDVCCAVIHHFDDGYNGFGDAIYYENGSESDGSSQRKWLRNIKKNFKPDVTISTLFGVSTLSLLAGGSDKKIGIFHSPHYQIKAKGWTKYLFTLLQYTFLYPRLDKLCCVSEEVKDSLSAFPWIRERKKQVVYNVHNLDQIIEKSKVTIEEPVEREIFNHPTIIFCGRLDRNKAPIRSIEAFAKAVKPIDAQLVFLGNDEEGLQPELETKAKELGIANNVHFLGRKQNPYKYIHAAKALISTSYSEGLPGVMIEALTLGITVVTTNSSRGIWEIFYEPEKYDKNLDGIFENDCGFITSNLSAKAPSNYNKDIDNLAGAIGKTFSKGRVEKFEFSHCVKAETILTQLLSNL